MALESLVGRTFGKYQITEHLGRGGMADVYKGYRADLDRVVAIKLMHPFLAADEDFIFRFKREARAMASMRHPNIVTVHDFDVYEKDTYYLVMEFIGGGTLKEKLNDLVKKGELMPLGQVLDIALAVTDALAYAHDREMVHRDIKPGNIMLDENGRAVLTDFGIVKLVGGQSMAYTATGALIGTPAYMSPEQALGKPGDARSDIYSFGILLFQMLTGQLPFEADTPLAVVMKQVNDPPPLIHTFNPNAPPVLQEIIFQAMAKKPEERFQTAAEMGRALSMLDPSRTRRQTLSSLGMAGRTVTKSAPTEDVSASAVERASVPPKQPAELPAQPTVSPAQAAASPAPPTPTAVKTSTPGTIQASTQVAEPAKSAGQMATPPPAGSTPKKPFPWLYAAGGFVLLLIIIGGTIWLGGRQPEDEAQPTATSFVAVAVPTATATPLPPTKTPTSESTATATEISPTPTESPTSTATPSPTATLIPIPEGMISIAGTTFIMGANEGRADEQPAHSVTLSAYFIDEFEVSNSQYQACVADGSCAQVRSSGFTRVNYRDNPEFANFPVVGASWNQATAYCSSVGKRLPTEAEWEYAASGPDKNIWPWGNSFDPNLSAASADDTQAVDSFPAGRSAFGVFNMAGNVAEWVQDNYSTSFYAESEGSLDPVLENGGNARVFRGGSFANTDGDFYRTSRRYSQSAGFSEVDIGFRCAQTAP